MKRIYLYACLLIIVTCNNAYAADEHPIDRFERECIDKDWTTSGMAKCTYEATKKWEEEMNKYYNLLQGKLTIEQQSALNDAQQAWVKFRDAEYKNINEFYSELQGTMYINLSAADHRAVVKQRALDLKTHYDILMLDGGEPSISK